MAAIDLTTVDSVKEAIMLPTGDLDLDTLIPDYITAASQAIMNHCKREFAPVTIGDTRQFPIEAYTIDLSPYDLQSATAVVLHPETTTPTTLAATSYQLKPFSPDRGAYTSIQLSNFLVIQSQTLYGFGYAIMAITGTWGFPSIPPAIARACSVTVASWLTRTSVGSSYGIPAGVGGGGGGGVTYRNDWHIPWAAVKLISPYRRGSSRWL